MYLPLFAALFVLCSLVNALSIDASVHARHAHIGHSFAKRNQRCKARSSDPSPSSTPYSSPQPSPTTSSQLPASTPAASNSGGGKACLAMSISDGNALKVLNNFKLSKVGSYYTWSPYKIAGAALEFSPLFWGPKSIEGWQQVVAGYASTAQSMNEPDIQGQSVMSPEDAAGLFQQYLSPLRAQGYRIGSPATSSSESGLAWLKNFVNAVGGTDKFDVMPAHWYGVKHEELVSYLQTLYATYNKPIWLTEFACTDFSGAGLVCPDVNAFAGAVTAFIEATPWVERYCPFALTYDMRDVDPVNTLMGADLMPTNLAHIYFG